MHKHLMLAACAACAGAAGTAQAATLVNFTFNAGNVFVNPADTALNPDVAVLGPWTVRDGALIAAGLNGQGGTGRAIGAQSFGGADATPAGNAFSFQFTTTGKLALTEFSFWEQGSSGANGLGPTDWTLSINGNPVASGAATQGNPGGAHDGVLALTGLTGVVTVEIAAFGAANNATATWRIDDFVLAGTVQPIPLPATLPLLAGAAGLLTLRRRRG
jgi:hypothetical protein